MGDHLLPWRLGTWPPSWQTGGNQLDALRCQHPQLCLCLPIQVVRLAIIVPHWLNDILKIAVLRPNIQLVMEEEWLRRNALRQSLLWAFRWISWSFPTFCFFWYCFPWSHFAFQSVVGVMIQACMVGIIFRYLDRSSILLQTYFHVLYKYNYANKYIWQLWFKWFTPRDKTYSDEGHDVQQEHFQIQKRGHQRRQILGSCFELILFCWECPRMLGSIPVAYLRLRPGWYKSQEIAQNNAWPSSLQMGSWAHLAPKYTLLFPLNSYIRL